MCTKLFKLLHFRLIQKIMPFVQCLWLEVFVEKRVLSHLKTPKTVAMETKVSGDQDLDKLSEKLNSRLLVQEELGFQKGAQGAPWPQQQQKKPGLDRV